MLGQAAKNAQRAQYVSENKGAADFIASFTINLSHGFVMTHWLA